MIPLRDLNPIRTTPFVNYLIIVVNVLMFSYRVVKPSGPDAPVRRAAKPR